MISMSSNIVEHLSSGYVLLQLASFEEERALAIIRRAAAELKCPVNAWSVSSGFGDANGAAACDPLQGLARIAATEGPRVFVLLDFHRCLDDPAVVRRMRELVPGLEAKKQGLIMLGPVVVAPRELEKEIAVLDLPPPNKEELLAAMDGVLKNAGRKGALQDDPALRDAVTRAALGLTEKEFRRVIRKTLLTKREFTREHVKLVLDEKKRVLMRTDLLEFHDVDHSLEGVGGLDLLKKWLADRAEAFGEKAREYGLPQPKGLLLLGVQGCGKSLSAKAVSGQWGMPLIRLDISAVFQSDSGGDQLRRSLRMSEELAPCVLWIDEIEKGFAESRINGGDASGAIARSFAGFLSWLQDKKSPVYVIATANSISELPAELVRKGRFDDIFFVDLPQQSERKEIAEIHLSSRGRNPADFNIEELVKATEGFSGSEIEQVIVSGMYEAFTAGREVSSKDLIKAAQATVPLSETMEERIKELRDWAKTRARPASLDTKLMDLLGGAGPA